MTEPWVLWALFHVFIFTMLALDLGVFHRTARTIQFREAVTWTIVWVILALLFNAGVFYFKGAEAGKQFLGGYLTEEALSVDNVFVFLVLFRYFRVDPAWQHKVLFWGIIGALVLRAAFIFAGIAVITKFHWTIYIMGVFLVYTGFRMATKGDEDVHPEKNPVLKLARRFLPLTREFHGDRFFTRVGGRLKATPLFVVLLVVETTDVMFAVDSIPAILAFSTDPFIVYTSNVFAILGLRSLYFAVAGMMEVFHHLHYGLSAILVWVGSKMLLSHFIEIPMELSLGFIAVCIVGSILASLVWKKKHVDPPDANPAE